MFTRRMIAIVGLLCSVVATLAQSEPYFTQTFDDVNLVTKDQSAEEYGTMVEGQGEWRFLRAYVVLGESMKTNYVKDGSLADLRMQKGGSYVITPVVQRGVNRVTFDEGRTGKYLRVYASTDEGATWYLVKEFNKNTALHNTVFVRNEAVSRIKIENDNGSNDCDVDNVAVYPYDAEEQGDIDPTEDNGVVDTFWCSPEGDDATADGSEAHPFFSLKQAVRLAGPGDTICMKAGKYVYDARIDISNCGKPDKLITLKAVDGRAVLDFSAMPYHKHSDNPQQGIRLSASYWHFYRIDITNASDNGLLIERESSTGYADYQAHDNLIEECNFYKNGDTGLQMKNLASWNRVVNCDSYLNCDEGQGDADGFAPKISVGDGNYFYGCRAWLNSDDGWDVFYKQDSGQPDDMSIVLENCIAYKNGFLDEETLAPDGNGNGFKMGSNQGAMNLYMNRCLAVCNKAKGFDQNHNAGDIILNNCTGFTLKSIGSKAYSYRIFENIAEGHEARLTNCVAINDRATTDKKNKDGSWKAGENGQNGLYGRVEVDTTLPRLTVVTSEFRYAAPEQFVSVDNHAELIASRLSDGSLPYSTFARLRQESMLIDRGTPVEPTVYRGIPVNGISYLGIAPDLGAYEYGEEQETSVGSIAVEPLQGHISVQQTAGGLSLITIIGAPDIRQLQLSVCDAAGRMHTLHDFTGHTTAVSLPQGVALLRVTDSKGLVATAKVIVK